MMKNGKPNPFHARAEVAERPTGRGPYASDRDGDAKTTKAHNERKEAMASYNRVVLMGNLTRDPEVRRTGNGTAVADLGLALNERYRNKEGEQVTTTCFVDVVVWQRLAEVCGEYLRKGSLVMIEGRLQLDQWQTEAGEKRSRLRVRAEQVQFLPQGTASAEEEPQGRAAART